MKRTIDVTIATLCGVAFSPLMIAIGLLVRLLHGSPVLFRQTRPGLSGRPFEMLKFRTMREANGSDDRLLPDCERLTSLGRFLRSTSLDELPELINVLRGEMSLVGPRPLLIEYLPMYTAEENRRHEVRPGITGWAQVNGRNAISWEEKFRLDVWYVDNQSLWLDFRVLMMTVWKVVLRSDISAKGHVTIPAFRRDRAQDAAGSATKDEQELASTSLSPGRTVPDERPNTIQPAHQLDRK